MLFFQDGKSQIIIDFVKVLFKLESMTNSQNCI